jgi:chemotaxis signal transduction protein
MSQREPAGTTRAQQLRAEFDHAFALAPAGVSEQHLDLLAIRCADHGFALPLSGVVAVLTDRKIVPVPSPAPALLGLVGIRGLVAPVYDRRARLSYPGGAAPRWIALLRAPAPFAVAFDHFERHLRVPSGDVIAAAANAAPSHLFANGSVRTAAGPRPLIDLLALFAAVTGGARLAGAPEREDLR